MALADAPADPLLDRGEELAAISDALAAARGGTGTLLVVAGGTGIGKTRLLATVHDIAARDGMRCLSARAGEFERDLPFGVVRQLFEPVLAQAGPAERERLLDGAAALAAPAVDPSVDPTGAPATFATLHGLYWLTANLVAEHPLVVAVDDAQWVDAPSLRYGVYLARRLEGLSLLLVVAVRTGERRGDDLIAGMASAPGAIVLAPRALGEAAVATFVGEGLGRQPDAAFAHACHAATGGNPLLLHELVLELRERAVPPIEGEAPGIGDMAIDRVARPVLRRLGRLPEGAGTLARAVAVLGEGADLTTAALVAELPRGRAAELADALVGAGVLEGGSPLQFVHPLVRSAVAGSMGPGEREATHRRAARILAEAGDRGDRVAAHLAAAPPTGESWALETLAAAGRRTAARGAPDAAATYLRRALAERPEPDRRQELLLELGSAEARASDPGSLGHLEQALDAASGPAGRARAALALGGALASFGRFPDAVRIYERATAELGTSDAELALELEAELLSVAPLDLSTRSLGLERLRRLDRDLAPNSRAACKVLANLAREEMVQTGSRRRAIALAERSLSGGFLMAEEPLLTFPHAPVVFAIAGELDRAIQVYDEALARTRARGAVLSAAMIAALRSFAAHQCGRLAEAAADARDAVEAAEAYDAPLIAPYAAGFLASTLIAQGELAEAEEVLERVADVAAVPQAFSGVHVLSIRGRLRVAQGRPDEAAADLRECGSRLDAWQVYNPGLAPWRGELALAEHLRDRSAAARELAAEQLSLARGWGSPWVLARALRIAGLIEGERGLELLHEAVDTADAGGARLEHVRALVELGGLQRRSGSRRAAREPLRQGLDLALACGARSLAERAHAELVASGAQPRRLRASGPDALTPAERRVAAMAAEGMTNRAIAQALFVSEKTVETHLRSVFRKLELSSRSQLPAALGSAPDLTQPDKRPVKQGAFRPDK